MDNNRDQDTNQIGDETVEDESVENIEPRSGSITYDTNLAIDSDDSKLQLILFHCMNMNLPQIKKHNKMTLTMNRT